MQPSTIRWLSSDSELAKAAGADPAAVIIAEAGAVGDRFTRVVEVDENACLLIMARASEKVADVDLYAYSEDGTTLAVDDRADPRPTLLLCPPHPRHIYLTARIATGQGMIAVGVHRVPLDRSRRVQATLRAVEQHAASEESPKASIADVESRLRTHLRSLGGHWTPVAQTTLAVDSRMPSLTGLVIEPGSCMDALVLAPLSVSGVDIEALDSAGRTLGRSVNTEQDKAIIACAQEQRPLSLQLRPHEGSGVVLLLLSRGSLVAGHATEHPIELGQNKAIEPLVDEVHRDLRTRKQRIGERIAQTTLARGEQYRTDESLLSSCVRFDVFAGAPSLDVQARAYAEGGELISMNTGSQYMPLFVCGNGKFSVVIEAQTTGGPLWIERSPPMRGNAIAASPGAAARLLMRAWQVGLMLDDAEFSQVTKLVLGPKQNWEQVVSVQPGQCLDAFASLEGKPTGIRLHRVDPESNELGDGELHPESAHLQLCCTANLPECKHRVRVIADAGASGLFATSKRR